MKSSNTITVGPDGTIPIEAFKNVLNIKRVVYYELEPEGKNLRITFFDKNKKLIKAKSPRKKKRNK